MKRNDPDGRSPGLLAEAAKLRALAAHLVGDGASADDLVQDTWVVALKAKPAEDRPLGPWLAQVIRNLARRRHRSVQRRTDREQSEARALDVPSSAEIVERLDAQRTLAEVLADVAEPLRTTLVLRYFEDLTSVEIARLQGVPEGTVRWRIQRGLDEMRVRLDRRFGGSRGAWCTLFLPLARPASSSVAVTSEGVLAMGVTMKIAAAIGVAAAAGVLWWQLDGAAADAPHEVTRSAVERPTELDAGVALVDAGAAETPRVRQDVMSASAPATVAEAPATVASAPALAQLVDARFVDAAGAPWSGVHLAVADGDSQSAVSGADGRATLALPPDEMPTRHREFVARRKGCTTVTLGATVRVGEPTHLGDVVLAPATMLHGRVLDETGRGIVGARVGAAPPELGDDDRAYLLRHGSKSFAGGPHTTTTDTGAFDLEGVEPGTWIVWAQAEGTRYAWSEPIEVRESDVFGLDIVVAPLRDTDRIALSVVDPTGAPVPGAWIVMHYATERESGSVTRLADDKGQLEFVILRDVVHAIVASDHDGRWSAAAAERVEPGSLGLVIQLGPRRFVEVDVHDADQAPIEGCRFEVTRENPYYLCASAVESLGPGRHRLAIPSFAFRIQTRADGYRTSTLGPFDPAKVPAGLEVVLEPVPVVRGRVVADGKPIANASVSLHRAVGGSERVDGFTSVMRRSPEAVVTTGADGSFVLGCELTGELYVRAQLEGWVVADAGPFAAPRAEMTVDLELTHGGVIEGRVLLPEGRNAEGSIVGANHGDGRARTTRAGPGGVYRFEGLTPGKWEIALSPIEIRPDTTTSSSGLEPVEIEWSCEVVAGCTTFHDLDATDR